MDWIKIEATGPEKNRDIIAALLISSGSAGVVEGDSCRETSPSNGDSLTAYLPVTTTQKEIQGLQKKLKTFSWKLSSSNYKDIDWSQKWRRGVKPVRVGRFFVRPSFSKAQSRAEDILIEIDPGMAFGTGGHETTRLCLKALQVIKKLKTPKPFSLLDVGTGSGVLALGAFKLWEERRKNSLGRVIGIDNDPVALKVGRKNIALNKAKVVLSEKPLNEITGKFSVVVANILSSTLMELCEDLEKKISPDGFLILSGILEVEAVEVTNAFKEIGLKPFKQMKSGEWVALLFKKS
ncbi:MAG: 50S ribosomal protein L11 methyltransferase [Deltaproteobacteria bacterium]|nr:50S ribosomal protein L11 methyltransferase [Deltaproteobacteria bacterium]